MIVPTGVGAAIGGYAGDALPVARTLSAVVDCLITHPNVCLIRCFCFLFGVSESAATSSLTLTLIVEQVLNAAMLYWPMPNALYVEGYALDRFAEGSWGLMPVHQNRVRSQYIYFWFIYLLLLTQIMMQVGLVLDAGIEEQLRVRHLQVADAARASLGLPVVEYVVTDTPLQVLLFAVQCSS